MGGFQKGNGQKGGKLVNATNLNPLRSKFAIGASDAAASDSEAVLPPFNLERHVAIGDGAYDPQPLAAGQVLGKGKPLH